jgi:hypothetical protein
MFTRLSALVWVCLCLVLPLSRSVSAQAMNVEFVNGVINASLVPGQGNGDIGDHLNAAMALQPGGTVMVPNGTYSFSTTIEPPTNIGTGVTVDCGSTNTVLQYTGSGDAIFIRNQQNIGTPLTFRNCTIIATKESGPAANGIHIQASLGVSFYDCVVKNFKGYGVYNQGAIGAQFSNVTAESNGINLVDAPDETSHMSSNAIRWIGGSLQYPGTVNYWEAPHPSGRNQQNVIETIFEMATPMPQAVIEACDSCTIRNSYIEYIGVSGVNFAPIVIGNAPRSGYGSETNQYPKHFHMENNLTFFPARSRSYAVFNVQGLTLNDLDEQGSPDCMIDFAADPTIGIHDVNIIAGLYNYRVEKFMHSRSSYFGQFR